MQLSLERCIFFVIKCNLKPLTPWISNGKGRLSTTQAVYDFISNLKSDKICIKQSKYSFNTIYKKQTGESNLFYKKYPLMKMVQALQIQDENCTISVETKVNTIFIIATTL